MLKIFMLGFAGGVGTVARFGLSGLAQRLTRGTFPAGTLTVNLVGCLAIGVLTGLARDAAIFRPETKTILVVGFLGGFTTFSAFGFETLELLRGGSTGLAAVNIATHVVLGVAAVWLGDAIVTMR